MSVMILKQLKSAMLSIAISVILVLIGCYILTKVIGFPVQVESEEPSVYATTPLESPLKEAKSGPVISGNIPLSEVEISVEKTSCYGPCPVYAVYLYGDGTILYEGVENVRVIGERRSSIPVAEVVDLVNSFLKSKFLEAPSDYTSSEIVSLENDNFVLGRSSGFDGSTTTLYFKLGERSNAIHLLYNYPAEIIELVKEIDRITGTQKWVGDDY